ncbi:MAG: hypothetical protein K8T25_19665 [Planctomycetia bacterium]|nr:hypothetical protein [Planctomycetia bacterium]
MPHLKLAGGPRSQRLPRGQASSPSALLSDSPPRSKLRDLLGLLVVLAFAASYLQLGLVPWHQRPASTRVNDGSEPTFFAFHIDPYGTTSEDFHLYVVRAKRIMERGWTDSPLTSSLERGHNYTSPLQVLLGMVATTTDGRPLPYSIFISCVYGCAWGILFLAARKFLPARIPTETIVLALLMAMLFEAVQYMFIRPEQAYRSWPALRNMRMSTFAWTAPLMLSGILAVTSLWLNRNRFRLACVVTGVVMLALAAADNWSFAMVWMCSVLVWSTLAARWAWDRYQRRADLAGAWRGVASLAAVLVLSFAVQKLLTAGISGDAMLRSGFGPAWRHEHSDLGTLTDTARNWLLPYGLVVLVLIGLVPLLRCFRGQSVGPTRWFVEWRLGPDQTWHFAAIGITCTLAMVAISMALSFGGFEPYVRFQFYWRVDPCLLFMLLLGVFELVRGIVVEVGRPFGRWRLRWGMVMTVALVGLFVYHQIRIQRFVRQNASRDYFLTKDQEALRPWLAQFDREHPRYTLATASPELNYLCAYWTHADLLLPSGFPYHTLATNADIEHQAVDLLRLYNTSPDAWRKFTTMLPGIHFTEHWRKSRIEAAGIGYMYHLFHRGLTLNSDSHPDWRQGLVDAMASELGDDLRAPGAKPDVLLIDQVSRALGQPDLKGYTLGIRAGGLEAWVLDKYKIDSPSTEPLVELAFAGKDSSASSKKGTPDAAVESERREQRTRPRRFAWRARSRRG